MVTTNTVFIPDEINFMVAVYSPGLLRKTAAVPCHYQQRSLSERIWLRRAHFVAVSLINH